MIIGGSAFYELLRDNYRQIRGRWVNMSKEENEANDNDPNISMMFADAFDSSDSEYVDIDKFEYNEDGPAVFPF